MSMSWGADYATAVAAGDYSEKMVNPDANPGQPIDFHMPRIATGTKVWAICEVAANTGTLDFFIAIQEITL